MDPWEMRPHASNQGAPEDTQSEEVRQARPLTHGVEGEGEVVPRVLPVSVVERVVGVPLIVKRPNAGAVESGAEAELPAERCLDVEREGPRRRAVRRQLSVEMIVGNAESQEPSPVALREHDPSNDATSGGRGCDRAIVLEPDRHVKPDRFSR